jgi:hypothetical protein
MVYTLYRDVNKWQQKKFFSHTWAIGNGERLEVQKLQREEIT